MKPSLGIKKTIVFSLIPFFLLFSVTEFALRYSGFHYYPSWTYDNPRWERDPYLLYKLKPNFISEDGSVRVNSFGFRGKEFTLQKDPMKTRIVCMGNSCTFGFEIKWTSYPDELEKILNSSSPKEKYEVINAGIPDYSSYQGLQLLEKRVLGLNPDIIIISYGWNDIRTTHQIPDKYQKVNIYFYYIDTLLNKFRVYQALNKAITSVKKMLVRNDNSEVKSVRRVSPSDFKNNLESMIKIARSHSIKVYILNEPSGETEDQIHSYLENFLKDHVLYNEIVKTVSVESQVPLIDIVKLFNGKKGEKLFDNPYPRKDLIHPNLLGEKLIANEIAKTILSHK